MLISPVYRCNLQTRDIEKCNDGLITFV